jgi:hypothetical protein
MDSADGEFFRAVPDSYALYATALGHTVRAAALRARVDAGELTLVIAPLALIAAGGMADCGERDCRRRHPADPGRELRELEAAAGVEFAVLDAGRAAEVGVLHREQKAARYLGDTVLAACDAAQLAHAEGIPVLTTPRARYCYVAGRMERIARRIEID